MREAPFLLHGDRDGDYYDDYDDYGYDDYGGRCARLGPRLSPCGRLDLLQYCSCGDHARGRCHGDQHGSMHGDERHVDGPCGSGDSAAVSTFHHLLHLQPPHLHVALLFFPVLLAVSRIGFGLGALF